MDTNLIRNLIRIGRVSTVDGGTATVTVAFGDKDDLVSKSLPVLQQGTKSNKAYWLPDIDSLVVCLFLPNPSGRGLGDGVVLGCVYSDVDEPPTADASVKQWRFSNGDYVKYDNGDLTVQVSGDIVINGSTINLNGG